MKTRILTNAGDPFVNPQGQPYVGAKIEFWLVKESIPCSTVDAETHEFISSAKITAVTNSDGVFEIALWPNARATTAVSYACHPRIQGEEYFESNIADETGTLSYVSFRNVTSTPTPVPISALQQHVQNTEVHLSNTEKTTLDYFSETAGGLLKYKGSIVGVQKVNSIAPDETGSVQLTASDIEADPSGAAADAVGTHESTYDHTTLHTHSNKDDLDKVSGTNTGDQDLSDYAKSADIPTALADLTDDDTHRVVTDVEKTAWNAKVGEAPEDDKTYGRKNGGWLEVTGAVSSVNGLTGAVQLTIPSKLADLTGDDTHRTVTDTEKTTWDSKQGSLGFAPEDTANKGKAGGYAPLDENSLVPAVNIPTVAITGTDYANMRIRNIKLMPSIPVAADFSGPGDIIGVYLPD